MVGDHAHARAVNAIDRQPAFDPQIDLGGQHIQRRNGSSISSFELQAVPTE
jgi:hypothetical protein